MVFISKLFLFILLISGFQIFAQKITINNPGGKLIYLDDDNEIKIRIAGYDSSKVIALCSKLQILNGEHGNYQIHAEKLSIGDVVSLQIYLEKKEGNYLLGERIFTVVRKNDLETGLGIFRNGDMISIKQLSDLSEVSVLDNPIKKELSFKIVSQTCLLEFQNGESALFLLTSNKISTDLNEGFQKLKPGDKVTFYNIALLNGEGISKTGSRIHLTVTNANRNEIREIKNKSLKTKDELLKIETFSIQSFESLSASEENQIIRYSIAFVPKKGEAEFMQSNGNLFSPCMKERIETILKPGDKILIDEIYFTRKDGSQGKCPAIAIAVL